MPSVLICGVPFMPLGRHDGRFIRCAGLFAFARRETARIYMVLHLELSVAIDRSAVRGHARWLWAVEHGMDSLLIHLAGRPADVPQGVDKDLETVRWHPQAQVIFGGHDADIEDQPITATGDRISK